MTSIQQKKFKESRSGKSLIPPKILALGFYSLTNLRPIFIPSYIPPTSNPYMNPLLHSSSRFMISSGVSL